MLSKASKPPELYPVSGSRSEDMEQLGLMASSIAHDFNNLLTGIMGHVSLALLKMPVDGEARSHMERAAKTAEYASALTTQLLNYSRSQKLQVLEYISINEIVNDVFALLDAVLLSDLDVCLQLSKTLPVIKASKTHIHQVVMNLIINAAEAIEDPENGSIVVFTGKCRALGWKNSCGFSFTQSMLPGEYVFLQVNDNGKGIEQAALDRIFEPFFSTKPTGRGLGLSMIVDIVREYDGYVSVKSKVGSGTAFRVCFPYNLDVSPPVH